MKWKKLSYRPAGKIVIFIIVFLLSSGNISAAEGKKPDAGERELPHLIQTTTPESDYRALTNLELMATPVLPEEDTRQAFENILCSCVRIQTRGHYGSGSIYRMLEKEIIIVTNRHVLQYWDEDSYVLFFNDAVAFGEILGVAEEADVGFVRISAGEFSFEELLTFRNIRMAAGQAKEKKEPESGLSEGSAFFSVDMASDFTHPVMTRGEIRAPLLYLEDFGMEMLYGVGEAAPGMSGSGIFDGYGNYLGMMTGATLQEEIAAVPGEAIRKEYESMEKTGS